MKLQPNVGSDRSWVWKVAADYSEDPPTSETLAIRFANSDRASPTFPWSVQRSLTTFQSPMISRRPSRVPRKLTRSCLPRLLLLLLLLPTSRDLPLPRPRRKRGKERKRRNPRKRRKKRPRPNNFYAVGIGSYIIIYALSRVCVQHVSP